MLRAMIVVSGTKRSGTSMWMQVLKAAGLPVLGAAFPRGWDRTIRDANPDGFFESMFREGIHWQTNPDPATGRYLTREAVEGWAVKIFVPGLIRTERAYVDHVIANVRAWREYEASLHRLQAMDEEARQRRIAALEATGVAVPERIKAPPMYFPAAWEWWMENVALLRDIEIRGLDARIQSYDAVLDDPEPWIRDVLGWIGRGDIAAAVAAVKPEHRTQHDVASETLPPEIAALADTLYDAIDAAELPDEATRREIDAQAQMLLPELSTLQVAVERDRAERDLLRRRAIADAKARGEPPPAWAASSAKWGVVLPAEGDA
jgi:hypothetical protein